MLDLIERLEKAESGSRALDGDITATLGLQPAWAKVQKPYQRELFTDGGPGARAREWLAPKLTTSLDAIVALIGEKLLEHDWSIGNLPVSDDANHEEHHNFGCLLYEAPHVTSPRDGLGHGATAPLAACIALLRALQTKEAGHG